MYVPRVFWTADEAVNKRRRLPLFCVSSNETWIRYYGFYDTSHARPRFAASAHVSFQLHDLMRSP